MIRFTRSAALLLVLFLTGCTYFNSAGIQSRDNAYLQAHSISPMRIPPGVSSNSFSNEYPVSDRSYSTKTLQVSAVPPGL